MKTAQNLIKIAKKQSSKKRAEGAARYFKTGKGQYGEGDIFCGLTVPQCRKIAHEFYELNSSEIQKLLESKIHEIRLIGLLILVERYQKSNDKKEMVNFYIKNIKHINNWDLVDLTAHKILGDSLLNKSTKILEKMAESKNLWERRIAVISTAAHIKNNDFKPIITLSKKLLRDEHDLMHKAVGWMLREMGKRSEIHLKAFLNQYANVMPRTMLRYAIEKFPENERKMYLLKK